MEPTDFQKEKLEWLENNKDRCILTDMSTFMFLSQYDIQDISPCCSIDNTKINLKLEDLTSERPFAKLEQQFTKNKMPEACHKCEMQESIGAISERGRSVLYGLEDKTQFDNYVKNRNTGTYSIHIKFSNFCNLACRICSASESTTYGKTTKTTKVELDDISENPYYWNIFLNFIEKKLAEFETIDLIMVGGETMLAPGFYKVIDWLCDNSYASRVQLKITTNLTVNPSKKLLEQFSQFKQTGICASLDSTYENFHYVRWPAKWSKIEENLATLIDYQDTYDNLSFYLTINWNLNNIFYINDFIEYWHNCKMYNYIYVMHLYFPSQLQVEQLPKTYVAPLVKLLTECLEHPMFKSYPRTYESLYDFIKTTIEYFKDPQDDPKYFDHYLKYSAGFDTRTDTSLAVYNKRLYDLLTDEDKNKYQEHYQYYKTHGTEEQLVHIR